ncbi:MAG: PAS domain-containing sensor histidine kinase, partial [Gammaproteobacteria bacterium]|nr:PAS domain-containing sensor histidine kinase [Gammaproteobacteria bacterium]
SGIEPAHMNRLFEPFFTTKPVGSGTGLGLSLSYSIAKKHQGDILVHSVVGEGSSFTLVLPVHGSDSPSEETTANEFAAEGNESS